MRLDRVTDDTPIGTRVVLIDDQQQAHITETRSVPWRVCGTLMVKVFELSDRGYRGDRCFILPDRAAELERALDESRATIEDWKARWDAIQPGIAALEKTAPELETDDNGTPVALTYLGQGYVPCDD
jgi:hypothetical protein